MPEPVVRRIHADDPATASVTPSEAAEVLPGAVRGRLETAAARGAHDGRTLTVAHGAEATRVLIGRVNHQDRTSVTR